MPAVAIRRNLFQLAASMAGESGNISIGVKRKLMAGGGSSWRAQWRRGVSAKA